MKLNHLVLIAATGFLCATLWVAIRGKSGGVYDDHVTIARAWKLRDAIDELREARGSYPTGSSDVITAQLPTNLYFGTRSTNGIVKDAWGMDYRITILGTNIAVRSAGPDRKFGTADDIAAP